MAKFIKKDQTVSKKFLNDFKKKTGREYVPTYKDSFPVFIQVDDNYNPIEISKKVFDGEGGWKMEKEHRILTQYQLNSLRKMGQKIEIFTDKEIKENAKIFETLVNKEVEKRIKQIKKENEKNDK